MVDYVTMEEFLEQGPSGRELAHDENASVIGPVTNATTVSLGVDISFTVGDRPVVVELFCPMVYHTNACEVLLQITNMAASVVYGAGSVAAPAGGLLNSNGGKAQWIIRTPGSYSCKASAYAGTGTPILGYTAETAITLRAVEQ